MYDIISIGSATRDVFLLSEGFEVRDHSDSPTGVEQCFPLGSKIEIKKIVFTSGGGGTNAAVTFSRQGYKTACIGAIGNDLNGQEIKKELENEGTDVQYFQIPQDADATAYSVILVHPSAERTILSYKGEGQNFDVNKIPFDNLKSKWLFLDSLGGHYDLLTKAINWASQNGVKIATNPGGKELAHGLDKLKPLLLNSAIFSVNQEEAATLLGINYDQEEEIFKKMDELIPGIFVMTKGHEGVVVSDGKKRYKAGTPDSPVVERTGAGDAFISGFVAEYARSENIEKAIQLATANSSSVVAQFGSKAGILKKGDLGPWPLVAVTTT